MMNKRIAFLLGATLFVSIPTSAFAQGIVVRYSCRARQEVQARDIQTAQNMARFLQSVGIAAQPFQERRFVRRTPTSAPVPLPVIGVRYQQANVQTRVLNQLNVNQFLKTLQMFPGIAVQVGAQPQVIMPGLPGVIPTFPVQPFPQPVVQPGQGNLLTLRYSVRGTATRKSKNMQKAQEWARFLRSAGINAKYFKRSKNEYGARYSTTSEQRRVFQSAAAYNSFRKQLAAFPDIRITDDRRVR